MKMNDRISEMSEEWTTQYSDSSKAVPQKRTCTDCFCLLIFVIFIVCWLFIGYYAYWNGDINRLFAPRDSFGRTCGMDADVKNTSYLFFYDISECVSLSVFLFGCPTKQICVRKCPENSWSSTKAVEDDNFVNWKQIQKELICDEEHIARTVNSLQSFHKVINEKRCASYYVKSTSDFFRMCLPNPMAGKRRTTDSFGILERTVRTHNYFNYVSEVFGDIREDISKCWHFILLFVLTGIVSCIFTILIMGVVTKIFVWFVLWVILLLLFYSTIVTYMQYESIPPTPTMKTILIGVNSTSDTDFYTNTLYGRIRWTFQQKDTWLALCVSSGILFAAYFMLIIFLRSRIGIAVMLIGEGSKSINTIKSTLYFPLMSRVLQLVIVIWFCLLYVYVKSMGNAVYKVNGLNEDTDCQCADFNENDWCVPEYFNAHCSSRSNGGNCKDAGCSFVTYRSPKMEFYFQLYNFFGLLWSVFFISGLNRMVLSLCFATWYWTYNKNDVPFFTVTYSVYTTVRYHLGTIALGSFLIATCGLIRAGLERVHRIVKQTDGLVAQCCIWSLRGCFWILQKFLIFISNNAYVMCAVVGKGFFASASEAFGLLTRNMLRVVVLDRVLDFIMFVGKFAVTFILGTIAHLTFSSSSLKLVYPWVPTLFVAITTWIMSSSFFGVYSIAVETLFLSFLKDGELNDGSQKKPYYMSQSLKYILDQKHIK